MVVYCALDEPYAAPILAAFEKKTGIHVKTIYDSEAVKTAGIVNRLIAEKERPQCDVFWNNEKLRTVLLARKGLLEKYEPAAWKERELPHDKKDGLWSEFAARARVIVYNPKFEKELIAAANRSEKRKPEDKDSHTSVGYVNEELWLLSSDPILKGKIAIANPLFGTTSTHFLYWMHWTRNANRDVPDFFRKIFANSPLICAGNSDVVRKVAAGQAWLGYTDSDDAISAITRGERLELVFPHVWLDGTFGSINRVSFVMGSLKIPNTVAIIQGAPHCKEAEHLVDFLLSEDVEVALLRGMSKQIPLGKVKGTQFPGLFWLSTDPKQPNEKKMDPERPGLFWLSNDAEDPKGKMINPSYLNDGAEEELAKTLESDLGLLRKVMNSQ